MCFLCNDNKSQITNIYNDYYFVECKICGQYILKDNMAVEITNNNSLKSCILEKLEKNKCDVKVFYIGTSEEYNDYKKMVFNKTNMDTESILLEV